MGEYHDGARPKRPACSRVCKPGGGSLHLQATVDRSRVRLTVRAAREMFLKWMNGLPRNLAYGAAGHRRTQGEGQVRQTPPRNNRAASGAPSRDSTPA